MEVAMPTKRGQGFTLIELLVFIVVISLSLGALVVVMNQALIRSVDPIVQVRLLELAQSQLDEVQSRKYDENTPTGGLPACIATCAGVGLDGETLTSPSTLDDVDDFNGYTATPVPGYTVTVSVTLAGDDLGLALAAAKLITVSATTASGQSATLSTYRANF